MPASSGYGQFCPVAKASEILATRWTPLILRELICGSTRFNEIHRGVPLMPRALLSRRLKQLQSAGVLERHTPVDSQSVRYSLTSAGMELAPIIIAMGVWGQHWVESALESPDWDAGVLMWDMQRRIDTRLLGQNRTVLQFEYHDAPAEMRRWWLLIEQGKVDLCQSDPGFEVDLYVMASIPAMARVWIGKTSLLRALDEEQIVVHGNAELSRNFSRLLLLSPIVEAAKQRLPRDQASHPTTSRS